MKRVEDVKLPADTLLKIGVLAELAMVPFGPSHDSTEPVPLHTIVAFDASLNFNEGAEIMAVETRCTGISHEIRGNITRDARNSHAPVYKQNIFLVVCRLRARAYTMSQEQKAIGQWWIKGTE